MAIEILFILFPCVRVPQIVCFIFENSGYDWKHNGLWNRTVFLNKENKSAFHSRLIDKHLQSMLQLANLCDFEAKQNSCLQQNLGKNHLQQSKGSYKCKIKNRCSFYAEESFFFCTVCWTPRDIVIYCRLWTSQQLPYPPTHTPNINLLGCSGSHATWINFFNSSKLITSMNKTPICNTPYTKKDLWIWQRGNFKANNFSLDSTISMNLASLCSVKIHSIQKYHNLKIHINKDFPEGGKNLINVKIF